MAIPTASLARLSVARHTAQETDSIMLGALGVQRLLKEAIEKRLYETIHRKANLEADAMRESGQEEDQREPPLPPITKRRRTETIEILRRNQIWLEQVLNTLTDSIKALEDPPPTRTSAESGASQGDEGQEDHAAAARTYEC